jgi:hypothetical protein
MTTITENKRNITKDEECRRCDECSALVTHSCTDARQVNGEWTESAERYGCAAHPVKAMIYFEDGRVISAKDYDGNA